MGQLETSMGAIGDVEGKIKTAIAAKGTVDTAALTAKVGKLLGDPKIPTPTFSDPPEDDTADADEAASTQQDALSKVTDAQDKVDVLNIKVGQVYQDLSDEKITEDEFNAKIAELNPQLDEAHTALESAEQSYHSLLA
jgi:peptidoglycan hydrolase CwlO-like protein